MNAAQCLPDVIRFRPAGPEDAGFIFSNWLKTYRAQANSMGIVGDVYWDGQHALIERLLVRAEALVLTINGEDVGFLVHGRKQLGALHYLYVKDVMRGLGVASAALNQLYGTLPFPFTHNSREKSWEKIVERRRLTFDPYLAWL